MSSYDKLPDLPHIDKKFKFAFVKTLDRKILNRIAEVAAAGFKDSPIFTYQRRHYKDHALDTISSYRAQFYDECIKKQTCVVVVKAIEHDPEEKEKVDADIGKELSSELPKDGQPIVAICSLTVPNENGDWDFEVKDHDFGRPDVETRDMHQESVNTYARETRECKESLGARGMMRLETLVVHPAYQRKGIGKELVRWCCQVADAHKKEMWVSAAPWSVKILKANGFRQHKTCEFKEPEKEAWEVWFGTRGRDGAPSSVE